MKKEKVVIIAESYSEWDHIIRLGNVTIKCTSRKTWKNIFNILTDPSYEITIEQPKHGGQDED